jgi:hypothetical protein
MLDVLTYKQVHTEVIWLEVVRNQFCIRIQEDNLARDSANERQEFWITFFVAKNQRQSS